MASQCKLRLKMGKTSFLQCQTVHQVTDNEAEQDGEKSFNHDFPLLVLGLHLLQAI